MKTTRAKSAKPDQASAVVGVASARDWAAVLGNLRGQVTKAGKRFDELKERRKKLALDVSLGDPTAQDEVAELERQMGEIVATNDRLSAAIADAERRQAAAAAEQARLAEKERARRVIELAKRHAETAREIWTAMNALAKGFGTYVADGREMAAASGLHRGGHVDVASLKGSLSVAFFDLIRTRMVDIPIGDPGIRRPLPELTAVSDRVHLNWAEKVLGDAPKERAA